MCHKSEQLLRGLLQHGSKAEGLALPTAFTHNLVVTPLPFMSITDDSSKVNSEVYVKEELLHKEKENESIERSLVTKKGTLVEDNTINASLKDSEQAQVKVNNVSGLSFCCNECNKTFTPKIDLVMHIRNHTGDKPYACNMCHKSFTDSRSLIVHKRIHTGDKPNVCNMCHKSFAQVSYLKVHIRIHTGDKPYTCNTCHKSFHVRSDLNRHKKTHR